MTEDQSKILSEILSWIGDNNLRNIAKTEMELLPEYFWKISASSSGKYHPAYCLGEGGLFRHVAAACAIAHELFDAIGDTVTSLDKDVVLVSLLLHDGYKHGLTDEGHTVHEHPKLMADYFRDKYVKNEKAEKDKYTMRKIEYCIACHMGKWTTSKYSDVVLNSPVTELEAFVHYCDFLASRKMIEVKLEEMFNADR